MFIKYCSIFMSQYRMRNKKTLILLGRDLLELQDDQDQLSDK